MTGDGSVELVKSVSLITAKGLLVKYKSDDHLFASLYNMNLYRGCAHGCIYCDTRSECYGIVDISKIAVKENALALLADELGRRRERGVVSTGSMNDPYMPLESRYELSRGALKLLLSKGFPVHVITKSALVTRDADILADMSRQLGHAVVTFSITTVDDAMAEWLEPGASRPSMRLSAMRLLSEAGVRTGVAMMPILPGLTDELECMTRVVKRAAECGASYVLPGCLTLRDSGRDYYYSHLSRFSSEAHIKTMEIYGDRYMPPKWYSRQVWETAEALAAAAGLETSCPRWSGQDATQQLSLFDVGSACSTGSAGSTES